ncbi:MAG TPA: hypothetical protein VF167_15135 [Longimicrobiaceae bacterium]
MSTTRPDLSVARRRSIALPALALLLFACGSPEPGSDEVAASADSVEVDGSGVAQDTADSPTPSAPSAGSAGTDSSPPLTPEGWGPIRIGMTRAELVAAAGEDANPEAVGGPEPEACDEFRPTQAPEGMLVMVERDRVTRITISAGADVRTDRGFGVGGSAEEIKQAYGEAAETMPHKYSPAPAEYITVWTVRPGSSGEARGIVYEVGEDGRVAHIHAGGPSIQYVEGCL